jgi:hypothetical protein
LQIRDLCAFNPGAPLPLLLPEKVRFGHNRQTAIFLTAAAASGTTIAMIARPLHPPLRKRTVTTHDLADIRAALDRAQDIARAHGDDCRLAFRKADRALDRIATALFAKKT